ALEHAASHSVWAFGRPPLTPASPPQDQSPFCIKGANQPRLIGPHVGLNPFQRILGDEECSLHCAVVSPKTHCAPCRIERAALVGKTQRHYCPFEAVHAGARSRNRP